MLGAVSAIARARAWRGIVVPTHAHPAGTDQSGMPGDEETT